MKEFSMQNSEPVIADLFEPCREYIDPDLAKMSGLYPYFHPLQESSGSVVRIGGKEVIMMGSNNYLGLTHHPEVMARAKEAIDRYGTGCTGSRFLNGNLKEHELLEEEIAEFFQKPSALVFSSGFLANAGVIATLGSHPGAVLFSQRENHASLIEGVRLSRAKTILFHDARDLAEHLKEQLRWTNALVITDSVFSMTGKVMDLRGLAELKKRYGFYLYVDDAHGIGVLGPEGRGAIFDQGVENDVDLIFGTFSKSLASLGGFVAGDERVINYLRHKCRTLIFTAALPPSQVASARAALKILREDEDRRKRLWENAELFRRGVEELGFYTMGSTTPIIPLFIGSESLACRIFRDLLDEGIFTTPVVYPAVPYGQALIRTSVTPEHTHAQLEYVLQALARIRNRYPIPEVKSEEDLPRAKELDLSYFLEALSERMN
jgi:8-amino-7-oxononanoate synthase